MNSRIRRPLYISFNSWLCCCSLPSVAPQQIFPTTVIKKWGPKSRMQNKNLWRETKTDNNFEWNTLQNEVLIRTPGKLKPNEITPEKQPTNRSVLGFQASNSTVMLLLSFEISRETVSCLQNRSCFDKSPINAVQLFKFSCSNFKCPESTRFLGRRQNVTIDSFIEFLTILTRC